MLSAETLRARWEIAETAQRMKAGEISFLVGAGRIAALAYESDVDPHHKDFLPFIGVVSETDKFPMDMNVRRLWDPDALRRLEPEIDAAEKWAKKMLEQACSTLIERFGPASVRRMIGKTAQAILAREVELFAGIRQILVMREFSDLPERDSDIARLIEVVTTHEYLPLSDGRENWPTELLKEKFPEIVRAQEWGWATAIPACRRLAERLAFQ